MVDFMDDGKRANVRRAALEVFLRFGYRKVTMDDIARDAGMSRPALYLVFPNKEAVFRDVVRAGLDDLIEQIEEGLPKRHTLAEQLAHVFEVSTIRSFDLVSRAPAANELMGASFDFAKDLFDRYEQRRAEILVRLIRSAVPRPDALRPSAAARARVMIAAAHGFKSAAKDLRDMEAFVSDMILMTVAGLPIAERPSRPKSRPRSAGKPKRTPRGV